MSYRVGSIGRSALVGLACLLVAACTSDVEVFSQLPSGTRDQVQVTDISVELWDDPDGSGPPPDPALEKSLQSALKRALGRGAGKPIQVAVYITDLEHVEPGEKWILGGYRALTAEVHIREVEGGELIGHYRFREDLAKPSYVWPALELDEPSEDEIAANLASSIRRLLYY